MINHSSEALSGLKTEPVGSYLERKLERNLKVVICVTIQYYTNGRQSVDNHYMQEPSKVILPWEEASGKPASEVTFIGTCSRLCSNSGCITMFGITRRVSQHGMVGYSASREKSSMYSAGPWPIVLPITCTLLYFRGLLSASSETFKYFIYSTSTLAISLPVLAKEQFD
jgi:hypothetical protein